MFVGREVGFTGRKRVYDSQGRRNAPHNQGERSELLVYASVRFLCSLPLTP
jgi:hypothetical protein